MKSGIITARTAGVLLGHDGFVALQRLGRHRTDECMRPYWLVEEWDDLLGLIGYEMSEAAGWVDPTTSGIPEGDSETR
jgi:hypothetical protein